MQRLQDMLNRKLSRVNKEIKVLSAEEQKVLKEQLESQKLQNKIKMNSVEEPQYPLTGGLNLSLCNGKDAISAEASLKYYNKSKHIQQQKQEKRKNKVLF